MEKQEVTFDYSKSEGSYEVYLVVDTSTNTLLYIGHGVAGRHKHTYSGTSHVYGLNYEHFKGTPLNVKVISIVDKDLANLVEFCLISKLQPKYNQVGLTYSSERFKDLEDRISNLGTSAYATDLKSLLLLSPKDFRDLRGERFKVGKKPSTKNMIEVFKTDPEFILEVDPELYLWVSALGLAKVEALQFRRSSIKACFERETAGNIRATKQMLKHWFKVGNVYKPDEIKVKVQNRTGIAPKSTQEALKLVRKYYEVKATVRKGFKVYQIVRII